VPNARRTLCSSSRTSQFCDSTAIDILQSHPEIRAVFTDIDMPGTMDGIETRPRHP
jgi:CheY-like chemotaxis protein